MAGQRALNERLRVEDLALSRDEDNVCHGAQAESTIFNRHMRWASVAGLPGPRKCRSVALASSLPWLCDTPRCCVGTASLRRAAAPSTLAARTTRWLRAPSSCEKRCERQREKQSRSTVRESSRMRKECA
eukprot:1450654-Rhodomonas_salina.2